MQSGAITSARPLARARSSWSTQALPLAAVTLLAVVLRFAMFDRVPLNPYYDAAVRSMGLSWHNFFYGAFEPAAQVSIDKAPIDLWLQVLSVKLLGFDSIALRLPEALAGALAVPLLYDLVRRLFGHGAGLVAAITFAVLPAAVLDARSDTMDSLMMLALVAAGWAIVVGARSARAWPVVGAGALVGLAFEVKLFQALIVVPALLVLALLVTDIGWRRRAVQLIGGAVAFLVVGLGWVAVASLAPLGSRPYPIGSTNGSIWNVVFAFNGLHRLRASTDPKLAAFDPAGPARMFSTGGRHLGPLIGVALVPTLILIAFALAERLTNTDVADRATARLRRAGAAYVAVWLATGLVLLSAMSRIQVRYLEVLTPAVAAACGIAFASLAVAARRRPAAASLLVVAAAATAAIAPSVARSPGWVAPVAIAAATVSALAAYALTRADLEWSRTAIFGTLATAVLVAILVAPLARTLGVIDLGQTSAQKAGGMPAAQLEPLSAFLRAHQTGRYEVASTNVAKGAPLIIRDARPVLMLTSLGGRPLLTPRQLERKVAGGQVRYLLTGRGTCAGRPVSQCVPVLRWARAHSTDVSAAVGLRRDSLARLRTAPTPRRVGGTAAALTTTHTARAAAPPAIARLTRIARRRYGDEVHGSAVHVALRAIARDPGLKAALVPGRAAELRSYVRSRFRTVWYHQHVSHLRIARGSRTLVDVGVPFVVKAATHALRDAHGHSAGTLAISIQDVVGFVRYMHRNYPVDVIVRSSSGQVRTSLRIADPTRLPDRGTTVIAGRRYAVGSFHETAFPHQRLKVWVLARA